MPRPDSSRDLSLDSRWNESDAAWPINPAAPRHFGARLGSRAAQRSQEQRYQEQSSQDQSSQEQRAQEGRPREVRPKEKPEQDGRTPYDPDGNEEHEREQREEKPASHRAATDGGEQSWRRTRRDVETDDTGEWVATQPFTLEDELEDTWPNVPTRYLDD